MAVYDVHAGKPLCELKGVCDDLPWRATWDGNGTVLYVASRDKMVRIVDPRAGKAVAKAAAHTGTAPVKAMAIGDGMLLTTGSSTSSERQISAWDLRQFGTKIATTMVDQSSGTLMSFLDYDCKVLYIAGKGDSSIKFYEVGAEIHYLSEFKSAEPQLGLCMLPKLGCDVKKCEVARFMKLTADQVLPISCTVPRKNLELFQDDIFVDSWSRQPCDISAAAWLGGSDGTRSFVSMHPPGMAKLSDALEKEERNRASRPVVSQRELLKTAANPTDLQSEVGNLMQNFGASTTFIPDRDLQGVADDEWD